MTYEQFIESKRIKIEHAGIDIGPELLNTKLFPFQRDIVRWALRKGRASIFCDCGLGKTAMQLEWARHVPGKVLILAPLAVGRQTEREGAKFGIPAVYSRQPVEEKITITNYEMLEHFSAKDYAGVVLDESSILKSFEGQFRNQIIASFWNTPYRLACTATPAPNDYMELGNHSEFMGQLTRTEMLSTFFVHDGGDTAKWRLKKHAAKEFWLWICTWAVMMRKPSDLGYSDEGFELPELVFHESTTEAKRTPGMLFALPAATLEERRAARSISVEDRVKAVVDIIGRRDKLAACGNGRMPSPEGKSIETQKPSASAGKRSAGLPKKTFDTCAPTTDSIERVGTRAVHSSSAELMQHEGESIPATKNIGSDARGLPERDHHSNAERRVLKVTSDSQSKSSANYSNPKMERAESVAENTGNAKETACTSITATEQNASAESSVPNATSDSVTLETSQNSCKEQYIIWCNLNSESSLAARVIPGAIEVTGSDSREFKEQAVLDFISGRIQVLVTKPSIFGYGLNLQNCSNVVFLGLSDSYEQFYQAVRRSWRFGQTRQVDCYIVTAENEGAVTENIKRKEADATNMAKEMVQNMHEINKLEIKGKPEEKKKPTWRCESLDNWIMHHGDCVDVVRKIPTNSIHYSIFSPPFASLYTYSDSIRDMGNCRTHSEFYEHFAFLAEDLYRVTMPGRCLSFHCMNLPVSKQNSGYIGIADFRGDLIRIFQKAGFIFHSEVCIWKDPVTAMQRTKAIGLLYKQLKKDSTISRQGVPDYLVTMRKHGDNPERVTHDPAEFPVSQWQQWASPVWMDINPSDTLQYRSAREHEDERHICPLQLDVIRRGIRLWSNPGDLVLSPFAGIGSEGYVAIEEGRKFVGVELKESYFRQALANLGAAGAKTRGMFAEGAGAA